jgi:N4-gp56 family major capsid protein
VFIGHPLQIRSMKKNSNAQQWTDIQMSAIQGGQITGNAIFTGAVGMYNGVIIHSDASIPYGDGTESASRNALGTANVARGVFMGAQALTMAMGRAQDNPNRVKWFEEIMDAGNVLRVTAGKMYGGQKNRFDSQDFATVTVSSYEVQ